MTAIIGMTDHLRSRLYKLIGLMKYYLLERQFIHTFRIGLVATTLALTFITAFLITQHIILGLGFVGVIAALCVVFFVWQFFDYFVLALMLTTTVAAPPIPRDITTTLLLLILLTLLWIIRLLLVERSFKSLRAAPVNRFVPLFALAVTISFLWSNSYADTQVAYLQNDKVLPRLVTATVLILSPVATLLFANFVRSTTQMKWMIGYYIVYGGLALLPKLITSIRPLSNFNLGGQLPVWASIFALGQLLCNDKLPRWQRLVLVVIIGGWVYVSFLRDRTWLSGWVPLFIGLGIVIFLRSRALFAVLAVVAGIYLLANTQIFDSLLKDESNESGLTRLYAGNLTLDIANQHFLFGTGPTGYYFYMKVILRDLFQLSHNNYIDIYAQTGIFGFVTYMLIWGSIGLTVLRTYLQVPKDGFEGGLAASLVAIYVITMLIMMLGDWVTPFTYTQTMAGLSYTIWPWLWAGLAIALGHLAGQKQTQQPQHAS
jgi:O-antigen ligase